MNSALDLDAGTTYPQPGVIACEIIGRHHDAAGREIMIVDTERPWGIESIEYATQFEVLPSSLVEWDWGSEMKRDWNGEE